MSDFKGRAPRVLDYYRRLYDATRNPVALWRAYRLARQAGVAMPEWVLEAFDGTAEQLQEIDTARQLPSSAAPAAFDWKRLLACFHFDVGRKGGPANPFAALQTAEFAVFLAGCVRVCIERRVLSGEALYDELSEVTAESESKLRRAWDQYGSVARAGDLEAQEKRFREVYGFALADTRLD